MEFDKLPQDIHLEILQYLPLEEKYRISRISKRFQEISPLVISRTKSISLQNIAHHPMKRLDTSKLSNLLTLCLFNLESIEIDGNPTCIKTFAQFTFPKLVNLSISFRIADRFVRIPGPCPKLRDINELFNKIVTNHPNLQNIKWFDKSNRWSGVTNRSLIFPNVTLNKLKILEIVRPDEDTFRSITGRCPNLTQFKMSNSDATSKQSFDNFFASCQNLERFDGAGVNRYRFGPFNHFWRLIFMRHLEITCVDSINDYDLEKISMSFPQLESLTLGSLNITNNGIAVLASLKNLKNLNFLSFDYEGNRNLDLGLRRLIECKHIQTVYMLIDITSTTLIALVNHCDKLRDLKIRSVSDIETIDDALTVVRAFGGFFEKNIFITIIHNYKIWESKKIRMVLDELEIEGHLIEIV